MNKVCTYGTFQLKITIRLKLQKPSGNSTVEEKCV